MKRLIFALFVVVSLASCTTIRQSATQRDVNAPIVSAVISDLEVSDQRITFTYVPTAAVRKGGVENCINSAIAAALQEGKYDVLVETQQALVEREGFFGRKITTVTVTGYPAKYKNFRSAEEKALNDGIVTGTLINQSGKAKTSWNPFRSLK